MDVGTEPLMRDKGQSSTKRGLYSEHGAPEAKQFWLTNSKRCLHFGTYLVNFMNFYQVAASSPDGGGAPGLPLSPLLQLFLHDVHFCAEVLIKREACHALYGLSLLNS